MSLGEGGIQIHVKREKPASPSITYVKPPREEDRCDISRTVGDLSQKKEKR